MNQSDKYYLKQGRLELGMLEEEQEESEKPYEENIKVTSLDSDKKVKHGQKSSSQLKISQEVYSVLHTMGQYLTQEDGDVTNHSIDSPSLAKKQRLEDMIITEEDQIKDMTRELSVTPKAPVSPKEMDLTERLEFSVEDTVREFREPKIIQEEIDRLVEGFFHKKIVVSKNLEDLKRHINACIKELKK